MNMKLSKKSVFPLVGVLAISAIVGGGLIQQSTSPESTTSLEIDEVAAHIAQGQVTGIDKNTIEMNTVPSEPVLGFKSKIGPLPHSLEGTVMANAMVVDDDGNLRISGGIKRVFDYFLSTISEEPLETVLARIDEYLEHYLDDPALGQAKDILAGYVELKRALYDFEKQRSALMAQSIEEGYSLHPNSGTKLALLEEQLLARNALRAQYLSSEVYESFYADEEVFDLYTISRMKVMADKSLSDEEQQAQLAQIDVDAPEKLVQSRQKTQVTDILKNRTAQLREQGADNSDIRALRTQMLGTDAANRFEALDQTRAAWKLRLNQYLSQRGQILATQGLSLEERTIQVDQLRASQFDTREQIRVKVYERQADA